MHARTYTRAHARTDGRIHTRARTYTRTQVREVLADANATHADVDEIVLVGGSTRMPIVQRCAWPVSVSFQGMATALRVRAYVVHRLLTDAFDGKTLHSEVDPDQAVAPMAPPSR
jgi:molecular chaperone DnaK (HSP70)